MATKKITMKQFFKQIGKPNHPTPPGNVKYTAAEWREIFRPAADAQWPVDGNLKLLTKLLKDRKLVEVVDARKAKAKA